MALLMGRLIPAQATMNAKMRTFVLNPMYSSLINFAVGGILIVVATSVAIALRQQGNWRGMSQAPWAWCGGLIGASVVVIGILAIPHTGAANLGLTQMCGDLLNRRVSVAKSSRNSPNRATSFRFCVSPKIIS